MRQYELAVILNPALDKVGQEKVLEKIKKIISDTGGKVGEVAEWGKRSLAYPIKKQKEGIYCLIKIDLEGKEAKKVAEKLRLEEGILRYLLIRKE